jgi:16S rRNA (cytidine1402-2'-O)-methyltransferase
LLGDFAGLPQCPQAVDESKALFRSAKVTIKNENYELEMRVTDEQSISQIDEATGRSFRIGTVAVPARPLENALYLVATPIGNLGDITIRALEVLAGAEVLACEDTRVTRILLDRYGIRNRPFAYHEHNAQEAGPQLIAALEAGKSVALVSDAGTPLVSDPGYRLGQMALEAGYKVVPIPGAAAPLAALVGSGMPSDAFMFAGFLPVKDKGKRDRLAEISKIPATMIFFESPHRIAASVQVASEVLGRDRRAVVCRELTKTFEEFRRGTLGELADYYSDDRPVKGEIVLLIEPPSFDEVPDMEEVENLLRELSATMPTAKAAGEAAKLTGLPRKELYQRLLDLKASDGS